MMTATGMMPAVSAGKEMDAVVVRMFVEERIEVPAHMLFIQHSCLTTPTEPQPQFKCHGLADAIRCCPSASPNCFYLQYTPGFITKYKVGRPATYCLDMAHICPNLHHHCGSPISITCFSAPSTITPLAINASQAPRRGHRQSNSRHICEQSSYSKDKIFFSSLSLEATTLFNSAAGRHR